jgi:hypothetical protein
MTEDADHSNSDQDNLEKEKLANIAVILERFEDTYTTKDWLLQQIKQNNINIPIGTSKTIAGILKACPPDFISHVLDSLDLRELEDFKGLSPAAITYHWLFADITASPSSPSDSTAAYEQASKLIVLNRIIERTKAYGESDKDSTIIIPNLDGIAVGFRDTPERPLLLAIEIHKTLSRYNILKKDDKDKKLYLKILIDTSPVYIINYLKGKESVYGPELRMARGVMEMAREMDILASARIANDIIALKPDYKVILHPMENYLLKNGQRILVYNVFGDGFGNDKSFPRRITTVQKKVATVPIPAVEKVEHDFVCDKIEVTFDIKDIKTMLVHHSQLGSFVNMAEKELDSVFGFVDGDTPRKFEDLNVKITDEKHKKLDIIALNTNKPTYKDFVIKLRKPLKPHERKRFVKIEWDWEEPFRHYNHKFPFECKYFKFSLIAPKELSLKQKVYRVDEATGVKQFADTPPTVKIVGNKTEVVWSQYNIPAHSYYRFEW